MTAADGANAEAHRRYEPSKLIEDYDGDRYVDDEWGYDECQRRAFVAGAEWQASRKAGTDAEAAVTPAECDHEFTDHCVFCGVDAHEWFNHYAEGVQS